MQYIRTLSSLWFFSNFLISAGAQIKWVGKRSIKIVGVKKLNGTSFTVMGDRIETGTWCVLATLTSGKLVINGFNPTLIKTELDEVSTTGTGASVATGNSEAYATPYAFKKKRKR